VRAGQGSTWIIPDIDSSFQDSLVDFHSKIETTQVLQIELNKELLGDDWWV
jgi:hypothetical protein